MPVIDKHKEDDFLLGINTAISESQGVDQFKASYLKDVLKKYEYYKKTFASIFTSAAPKNAIYTFRVIYQYDNEVQRVVQILGSQNFEDLAKHIILSMGWTNDHMHGYDLTGKKLLPDDLYTGSSLSFYAEGWEDDPHPFFNSSDILISDIDYKKQPVLEFTFDYGDGHTFMITFIERSKIEQWDVLKDFPRLIESCGRAPEQYPPVPAF